MKYLMIFMITISIFGANLGKVVGDGTILLSLQEGQKTELKKGESVFILNRADMENCVKSQELAKKGVECPKCKNGYQSSTFFITISVVLVLGFSGGFYLGAR